MKRFRPALFLAISLAIFAGSATADGPAKYVILLIGDGMGWWQADAAERYLNGGPLAMKGLEHFGYMTTYMRNPTDPKGPLSGEYWEDGSVVGSYDPARGGYTPWEKNPVPAYVQQGATDSAAAAGAMLDGHKCAKYTLNVKAKAEGYDAGKPWEVKFLNTIVDYAVAAGKGTGAVTSVNFYHSTPAASVVKSPYRKNHSEKIRQMMDSKLDVIMGAGHPYYDDNGRSVTPDWSKSEWSMNRGPYLENGDGEALFNAAVAGYGGRTFIETKADFEALAHGAHPGGAPHRVMGVAQVAATLQFNRGGSSYGSASTPDTLPALDGALVPNAPSLETMTKGALKVLEKNPNGFWLMVEGGAIDWAGHAGNLKRNIEEIIDFDHSVRAVLDWVHDPSNGSNWTNTLVIVTADHETGQLQPVGNVYGNDVLAHECWGVNCEGWARHTNQLVPIWAQGLCAKSLAARRTGDYRDNTDIFKVMYEAVTGKAVDNASYLDGCLEIPMPDFKYGSGQSVSDFEAGLNLSSASPDYRFPVMEADTLYELY
ncbi:MAG: alkaline phosphatase [Deltaproteobacteria bacterium]|nr:alkaline phosphatase [Deltaproteobacteria bacterium]